LTFISERINPKTGAIYVYECTCKRDSLTKKPVTAQRYIGKKEADTGIIIPPKTRKPRINTENSEKSSINTINDVNTPSCIDLDKNNNFTGNFATSSDNYIFMKSITAGPFYVLERISKLLGLKHALKMFFPTNYDLIESIAYYIAETGDPLYRIEGWSETHLHPFGSFIGAPRVTELLQEIKEDQIESFIGYWLKKASEDEFLFFDITSISSYAKSNEYIRYGYNRDGEKLEQINLAILLGQESRLPWYFRTLPGNINDVSTLQTTMRHIDLMGFKNISYVLDKGFYSQTNINNLLKFHSHFLLSIPKNRIWVEKILDNYIDVITQPDNYHEISDNDYFYAIKHIFTWEKTSRRVYLYIIYDNNKKGEDYTLFIKNLYILKKQILDNKIDQHLYNNFSKYLIIKNTPKRGLKVIFNNDIIKTYENRYCGFNCYLSSLNKMPIDIIKLYRDKDKVEKGFDDMKNLLDCKRLRVHKVESMNPRIFIQFISLILSCYIRKVKKLDKNLTNLSIREIFDRVKTIHQIKAKGKYGSLYTEIDTKAKSIFSLFNIDWPPN
jgi:transposase